MQDSFLIETENLVLRYFTMEDVEKVFQMSREEGMKKWIPDQVYEDEQESAEVIKFLSAQYINKPTPHKTPYVLGVELKSSSDLIGHVGLSPAGRSLEIGYAIEEKHQGKGYATEAVCAISDWSIKQLEVPEILGIVDSDNKNSCRVLEKAGYTLVDEKERNAFGRHCLCRTYKIG